MRILGVEPSGQAISWILVSGTSTGGEIGFMETNKLSIPVSGTCPADNYMLLKQQVVLQLKNKKPTRVAIIKALNGSGCSPDRVKIECIVELAAFECDVPTVLVAPQTVTAAMKKNFLKKVNKSFNDAFNGGRPLAPVYLEKAAFAAWTLLS